MAAGRRALIVATGRYTDPDLRRLRSPAQDAPALAAVLSDPAIGAYDVTRVVDEPHHVVAAAMEDFFADSGLDDLLLLHLSCHGVKDDDGRLYFAASDTRRRRLASSAVSAGYLNDLMDRCRARSIVVMLDCCYSGAFLAGSKGDQGVHLKERLSGHGRAVLTASNAIEYAWEGDELSGEPEASLFTAAIVDGLATGEADHDGDGAVSIEDLHRHVYQRVRTAKRVQTPLLWTFGVAGTLHVARTPFRPASQDAPTPADETSSPVAPVVEHDQAVDQVARRQTTLRPGDVPRRDAGPADAGPADAGTAPGRRPRVHGLASRWPRGGRRSVTVALVALMALIAAAVALAVRGRDDGASPADVAGGRASSDGGWLDAPVGLALDDRGGLYIAESGSNRITYHREGVRSRIAGRAGGDTSDPRDGRPADEAKLDEPLGLAYADGRLYVADRYHGTVRVISEGTITRFAGGGETEPSEGGLAVEANLDHTLGVAVDPAGVVYVSSSSHRVLRVEGTGVIDVVAGTGRGGFAGDDGPAREAALRFPAGLAVARDGTVYVADTANNRIRRFDATPGGVNWISTVAGNGDEDFVDGVAATRGALARPEGIAFGADGVLYIADTGNNRIRRVDPRTGADDRIRTVAGNGDQGYGGDGGPAAAASLDGPRGVAVAADGTIYIADTGNDAVRVVDPDGTITTLT